MNQSDRAPVPLLLMADYLADPIWTRSSSGAGGCTVPLDRLPLGDELKSRLRAWAARFDALMDTGYEWPSRMEEIAWVRERTSPSGDAPTRARAGLRRPILRPRWPRICVSVADGGLDERLPSIGALTLHRHPTVVGARVSGPPGRC